MCLRFVPNLFLLSLQHETKNKLFNRMPAVYYDKRYGTSMAIC